MRLQLITILLLSLAALTWAQSEDETPTQPVSVDVQNHDDILEASDFVVGLNALNSQLIKALDEQPTRRVIVLPFPDNNLRYTQLSSFIREQMVTALVASRKYQIVQDSRLTELAGSLKVSPMELGNSSAFKQLLSNYSNDNIVVGTMTDLGNKLSVMVRIIQGANGEYGGAAMVYLRVDESIGKLMGSDFPFVSRESTDQTGIAKPQDERTVKESIPPKQQRPLEQDLKQQRSDDQQEARKNAVDNPPTEAEPEPIEVAEPKDLGNLDDQTLYRMAMELLNAKQFRQSIEIFKEIIIRFPESDLADNAVYWTGEALYGVKEWQSARVEFQKVLDEYPYGNKVPAATLKRGYAEERLGMLDAAIASMEEVLSRFDKSDVARLAKIKIQSLRAEKQQQ